MPVHILDHLGSPTSLLAWFSQPSSMTLRYKLHAHFMEEKTVNQRDIVTRPRAHSKRMARTTDLSRSLSSLPWAAQASLVPTSNGGDVQNSCEC